MKYYLLISFLLFTIGLYSQQKVRRLSDENWYFNKERDSRLFEAEIPGFIHLDLLKNGLIPDPFYGENEKLVQWVDNQIWTYSCQFTVTEQKLAYRNIDLLFKGLDSYATIYLNDSLVLHTDNMFREYRILSKALIRPGNNRLTIVFFPALEENRRKASKDSLILPGGERVYSRKAQYMFGWDWGPTLVSGGIWKDVNLIFWNYAEIKNNIIRPELANDKDAFVNISTELDINTDEKLNLKYELISPDNQCVETKIIRVKGANTVARFSVSNPKLWWTYDLGEQNLYTLKVSLLKGEQIIEVDERKFGIRDIKVIRKSDSIGETFYFTLNDKQIFAKGANIIPMDYFPSRLSDSDYKFYMQKVREANMNMVRVWGGGIYESDYFYELCDEMGIMVWQDFMFAGAMYPVDSQFIDNVKQEVEEQIIRLNNHPSIALWCGNNEILEAWNNWGWQKQYRISGSDSLKMINGYNELFEKTIPEILFSIDPNLNYHPSSPTTGWGRSESLLQGDIHYWGVWWGMEPLEIYRQRVGRFVSEYGFQGMPSTGSLLRFIPEKELSTGSSSMKNHQKHATGYETIETYLKRDYPSAKNIAQETYLSQLLQARAMKIAIESHRKARPLCMGSLIWQLNDCWPVVSWSLIDYYKKPKAAYYQVKHSFSDVLISVNEADTAFEVFLISDLKDDKLLTLQVGYSNFKGKIVFNKDFQVYLKSEKSLKYLTLSKELIEFDSNYRQNRMLVVRLLYSDSLIAEENYYFVKPKNLMLNKPIINIELIDSNNLWIESIDFLAKDVILEAEGVYFKDNLFDLIPNQPRIVPIEIIDSENFSKERISINCLNYSITR